MVFSCYCLVFLFCFSIHPYFYSQIFKHIIEYISSIYTHIKSISFCFEIRISNFLSYWNVWPLIAKHLYWWANCIPKVILILLCFNSSDDVIFIILHVMQLLYVSIKLVYWNCGLGPQWYFPTRNLLHSHSQFAHYHTYNTLVTTLFTVNSIIFCATRSYRLNKIGGFRDKKNNSNGRSMHF